MSTQNKTVATGNVTGRGAIPLPIYPPKFVSARHSGGPLTRAAKFEALNCRSAGAKLQRVPVWAVVENPGQDKQSLVAMFLDYVAACCFSVDHAARQLVHTDVMRVRDDGMLSAEF